MFARKVSRFSKNICSNSVSCVRTVSFFGKEDTQVEWGKAISEAEKVVGYPTSFMNLRFWLSDEMSNVAVNMRKLIGTKHPLMQTAKGLFFDTGYNVQTRGLLVLLISKAAGLSADPVKFERHHLDTEDASIKNSSDTNGILNTQRSLAEITEMIHTATVLHNGIMEIDIKSEPTPEIEDLLYGNKMAILSGDYLLAKASAGLAALGNTYVVGVMASSIADLMEGACYMDDLKDQDEHFSKLTVEQWEELSFRRSGCLFAKSFQSALMLANHQEEICKSTFEFGRYFGLLRCLKYDLEKNKTDASSIESILNILSHKSNSKQVFELQSHYAEQALMALNVLKNSKARTALGSMVNALVQRQV